jgi:hypothetical protein
VACATGRPISAHYSHQEEYLQHKLLWFSGAPGREKDFAATNGLLTAEERIGEVSDFKGERWAWFVLWLLPVVILAELMNVLYAGINPGPISIFLAFSILGLILPYRRCFRCSLSSG